MLCSIEVAERCNVTRPFEPCKLLSSMPRRRIVVLGGGTLTCAKGCRGVVSHKLVDFMV